VSDFQKCIDELNFDLQRVHESAAANGLKLNPIVRRNLVRTRNLVVPAHRSLAISQSFVTLGCRAWNALDHCMKILPTRASFVSAVRRMVCGVDAELFICFDARVLYLWNPP
jgi:hypothetical protein